MKASYHTHTYRCKHAVGTEEEYIEHAIAEGLTILGFADHAPMPYKDGYVSKYKMLKEELDEYFSILLALKEKYKDKIEIKIGLEAEYYPSLFEESLELWRKYPIEYLILGQHFVPEESGEGSFYSGWATAEKERITAYADAVITGMRSGVFSYLAHPDLINYQGSDSAFIEGEYKRIIEEANRLGIPLEYNLLGMSEGRSYPKPKFWSLAAELGAKVIIGCDSHSPERVAKKKEIRTAEKYLKKLGIEILDEIELKKVLL